MTNRISVGSSPMNIKTIPRRLAIWEINGSESDSPSEILLNLAEGIQADEELRMGLNSIAVQILELLMVENIAKRRVAATKLKQEIGSLPSHLREHGHNLDLHSACALAPDVTHVIQKTLDRLTGISLPE